MLRRSLLIGAALAAAWSFATPAGAEPIELKLATFGPNSTYFIVDDLLPWAERVSRDSGGTIQIKHYGGSVLGNAGNMYDSVMSGAADIGWALQGVTGAKFIKSSVIELPFGYERGEAGAVAFWRLYDKGLIASDYDQVKLFGVTAWPAAAIQSKSKRVDKLEDLKGLKLRISGKLQADTVLGLGATPVNIAVDEIYQSMDRGVIDGAWASLTATRQFRLQEIAKYFLDVPLNGAGAMVIMKKETYDKLPAQARASFDKHSGEIFSRALGKANDGEVVRAKEMLNDLAKQGKIQPMYKLSDAEQKRWEKVVEPVADDWAKRVPNGKAILDAFRAELASQRTTN
jgi:TRAP-type C4-dicarboxylate transport system substrate-binding protein